MAPVVAGEVSGREKGTEGQRAKGEGEGGGKRARKGRGWEEGRDNCGRSREPQCPCLSAALRRGGCAHGRVVAGRCGGAPRRRRLLLRLLLLPLLLLLRRRPMFVTCFFCRRRRRRRRHRHRAHKHRLRDRDRPRPKASPRPPGGDEAAGAGDESDDDEVLATLACFAAMPQPDVESDSVSGLDRCIQGVSGVINTYGVGV
ncbi:Protein of unknown function [Gryllus bimaculatus]|nr:Protein of unknown function [Gryllus bimaculatus]